MYIDSNGAQSAERISKKENSNAKRTRRSN
jgi:hypothetical protein